MVQKLQLLGLELWNTTEHPVLHNAEINNQCLSSLQFLARCTPGNDSHFMDNMCVQCVCPGLCHPHRASGQSPLPAAQAGAQGTRQPAQGTQLLPELPNPTPAHTRPWVPMKDVVTPGPPSPQVFTGCGHWENFLTTLGVETSLSQPCQWQQAGGWQGRHGSAAGHGVWKLWLFIPFRTSLVTGLCFSSSS